MRTPKQTLPRRSTVARLVCVYEWSPTARLSQQRKPASRLAVTAAAEAGVASGGEGAANGEEEDTDRADRDREPEPDANMHARVGEHGGGWQTHLKVL